MINKVYEAMEGHEKLTMQKEKEKNMALQALKPVMPLLALSEDWNVNIDENGKMVIDINGTGKSVSESKIYKETFDPEGPACCKTQPSFDELFKIEYADAVNKKNGFTRVEFR